MLKSPINLPCFACDKEATSREHAPPQCIFPENKDYPGMNYRKNLITVPACDEHNLRKSKDDEYLMMILVAHFENNNFAIEQVKNKIFRAWERRPHLADTAFQDPSLARLNGEETMTFVVDLNRFNRSMELIARAVTFYKFKQKPPSKVDVFSTSMLPRGAEGAREIIEAINSLREALPKIFKDLPFLGENQEIFKYRIYWPIREESALVQLVFYEGFNICVRFQSPASKTSLLTPSSPSTPPGTSPAPGTSP